MKALSLQKGERIVGKRKIMKKIEEHEGGSDQTIDVADAETDLFQQKYGNPPDDYTAGEVRRIVNILRLGEEWWGVDQTVAWLKKRRTLRSHYEKTMEDYQALKQLLWLKWVCSKSF